jgi:hypothetical protein
MIPSNFCHPEESKWFIVIVWTVLFLLLRWKPVGSILRPVNTMFHETGHALMTLLFSGRVVQINLFHDSGVAFTAVKSWFARFMVSLAGYPFASLAAWLQFYFYRNGMHHVCLYIYLGVAIVNLVLWVRNTYGIIWLLCFIALLATAWYMQWEQSTCLLLFIFNSVLLLQSVWTAIYLLYICAETPREAGDAANLRNMTWIPAIFWAVFFCLFALAAASDICAKWLGYGYSI